MLWQRSSLSHSFSMRPLLVVETDSTLLSLHLARLITLLLIRYQHKHSKLHKFSITQWVPLCHYVCPPSVHVSCLIKMLGWKSRNYIFHLFMDHIVRQMENFSFSFQNSIFWSSQLKHIAHYGSTKWISRTLEIQNTDGLITLVFYWLFPPFPLKWEEWTF